MNKLPYVRHKFYVCLAYALYTFREKLSVNSQIYFSISAYASILNIFFIRQHKLA